MSTTETVEVIDATLDLGVYELARIADVHSPDTKESPGAKFLNRVQDSANDYDEDALLEAIRDWVAEGNDAEDYGVNDLPDSIRDDLWELADSDVQIYTYQVWQEFTDLCLYEEDVRDLNVPEEGDLTKIAMVAEAVVAERLVGALLAQRATALFAANPVADEDDEDGE